MTQKQTIIRNKVSELCSDRGIDRLAFISKCLDPKITISGRRLSADTAGRVFDGETGISLVTASLVSLALGVKISDLFDLG